MFTNTKIALAAALILGTASAALAESDRDASASDAQFMREWREIHGNTGGYGYFASPTQQEDLSQSRKKGHSR
jgi:hypothetical protein